jgi:hypothetical protein
MNQTVKTHSVQQSNKQSTKQASNQTKSTQTNKQTSNPRNEYESENQTMQHSIHQVKQNYNSTAHVRQKIKCIITPTETKHTDTAKCKLA